MGTLFLVIVLAGLAFGVWSLFVKKNKAITTHSTLGGGAPDSESGSGTNQNSQI